MSSLNRSEGVIDWLRLALMLTTSSFVLQGCVCHMPNAEVAKTRSEKIFSSFEKPVENVRQAVRQGIEAKGTLTQEDLRAGVIKGMIGTSGVAVKINQVDDKIVQVVVVVRNHNGVFEREKSSELDLAIVRAIK